jgi:glycosyltransferase involved in cell wall biosynthesis
MKRLLILTEIISPYRIPLFNALAEYRGITPHVIFLSETDPSLRQWRVYKQEIRFSYEVLASWRRRIGNYNALLNWGLGKALQAASPDVILCGGYNYLASWQSLLWSRTHSVPFLLWSESTAYDLRGQRAWVEFVKSEFLNNCTGFVVPGISAREYLMSRGQKQSSIFTAPNAVDNDLYLRGAEAARQNEAKTRAELKLPRRYFLFVGRLVREKGVFDLLSAYARLDPQLRATVGLVFAGDGAERKRLEAESRLIAPAEIRFTGFIQRDQIASYYALADMLILPTYTDTWGLVVNEAMACGLPVLVSRAAGCVADLVPDQWNGAVLPAADVAQLSAAMQRLGNDLELCQAMGLRSAEHILQYSPRSWCSGVASAVAKVGVVH